MTSSENPSTTSPPRILLVDDDPINQRVAVNLLRRHGWEAVAVTNGKEALDILAKQSFDLILMDLQMPEMDGFQTASVIRQSEAQKPSGTATRETTIALRAGAAQHSGRIPIIALTTSAQPGTREKCLEVGMDDYLTKPFKPVELYTAIEKLLGIGGA
jgi:CheY-like chemotaxis protein